MVKGISPYLTSHDGRTSLVGCPRLLIQCIWIWGPSPAGRFNLRWKWTSL